MEKTPNASNAEKKTADTEKKHTDTRRRWFRLLGAIAICLLLVGVAVAIGIVYQSQSSTISGLKHDKTDMAKQVSSSRSTTQRTKLALKAITVQLAKTKRALAVEKRKAANQFFSGYNSGYSTGQGDTSSAYNDGYSAGYYEGYNKGLCIDPNTGGSVC